MPEVTETPNPEITATPSPQPTIDYYYYIELVTPGGEPARIERAFTAGDLVIVLLLFVLLVSIWGMYITERLGGDRKR